ncbi:mechanosensitive ion channel family protein, partial [Flavobacterium circumlabens]
MEEFLRDIFKHVEGYYYSLVDITPKILLAILVVLISWFIAARVKVFADRRLKTKMHDPL